MRCLLALALAGMLLSQASCSVPRQPEPNAKLDGYEDPKQGLGRRGVALALFFGGLAGVVFGGPGFSELFQGPGACLWGGCRSEAPLRDMRPHLGLQTVLPPGRRPPPPEATGETPGARVHASLLRVDEDATTHGYDYCAPGFLPRLVRNWFAWEPWLARFFRDVRDVWRGDAEPAPAVFNQDAFARGVSPALLSDIALGADSQTASFRLSANPVMGPDPTEWVVQLELRRLPSANNAKLVTELVAVLGYPSPGSQILAPHFFETQLAEAAEAEANGAASDASRHFDSFEYGGTDHHIATYAGLQEIGNYQFLSWLVVRYASTSATSPEHAFAFVIIRKTGTNETLYVLPHATRPTCPFWRPDDTEATE